jgi:hypothetical protein
MPPAMIAMKVRRDISATQIGSIKSLGREFISAGGRGTHRRVRASCEARNGPRRGVDRGDRYLGGRLGSSACSRS